MRFLLPVLIIFQLCLGSILNEKLYEVEGKGYFTNLTATESGIVASNNLDNALYLIRDGSLVTLLENPGCGRYYSVSGEIIGFKYIDPETGLQAPATLDLNTGFIKELEPRTRYCGQFSFADDGSYAYTYGNSLKFVSADGQAKETDLGFYSNTSLISPDGRYVCVSGKGQSVILVETGSLRSFTAAEGKEFISHKWAPDSKLLAFTSIDGTLYIFSLTDRFLKKYSRIREFCWAGEKTIISSVIIHNERELLSSELILIDVINEEVSALTSTDSVYEMSPAYMNGSLIFDSFGESTIYKTAISGTKLTEPELLIGYRNGLELKPVRINNPRLSKDMLTVPYVNQVFSTDLYGHRYGCCAATSCAMVLAYYKIIPHWKTSNNNWAHVIFDNYIYNNFTYDDRFWSETYQTYYGTGGGDGFMWNDQGHGGSSPSTNQRYYLQQHGLTSAQYWSNFYTVISDNLNNGYMHPMCVMLSASGHLIDPIGIADAGQQLLYYNDPYGDKNSAYPSEYGDGVLYDWPGFNAGYEDLGSVAWTTSAVGNMPSAPGLEVDDTQLAYGTSYDDFDNLNDGFWMLADGTTGMKYWRHVDDGTDIYWWTGAMTGTSVDDYCASWNPVIQYPGEYKVEVYIPSNTELITNAKYQVHHNGSVDVVILDQAANAGSWADLGTFCFAGTDDEFIYLGDATGSKAVKTPHDEKEKVFKIVYDRIRLTQDTPGFTAGGDWQYGADGLVGSVSGGNIWGTVLNANHTDNTNSSLEWDISASPLPSASLLTFDHWYEAESGTGTTAYDGGNVKISVNGGLSWEILYPYPDYTHVISSAYSNPMPGEPCYSGTSAGWGPSLIDLSTYSGQNVILKWQFGSDTLYNFRGWYLDNITVSQLTAPQNLNVVYNGSAVQLTWDEVENASSYIIYSSTDPYGTFIQEGSSSTTSWEGTASETKKFYQIRASAVYKK